MVDERACSLIEVNSGDVAAWRHSSARLPSAASTCRRSQEVQRRVFLFVGVEWLEVLSGPRLIKMPLAFIDLGVKPVLTRWQARCATPADRVPSPKRRIANCDGGLRLGRRAGLNPSDDLRRCASSGVMRSRALDGLSPPRGRILRRSTGADAGIDLQPSDLLLQAAGRAQIHGVSRRARQHRRRQQRRWWLLWRAAPLKDAHANGPRQRWPPVVAWISGWRSAAQWAGSERYGRITIANDQSAPGQHRGLIDGSTASSG